MTQNIVTMGEQVVSPGGAAQTIICAGKHMTGNIVISGVNILKQTAGTTKTVSGGPWQPGELGTITAVDITTQIGHPVLAVFWSVAVGYNFRSAIVNADGVYTAWGKHVTDSVMFGNRIYAPFDRGNPSGIDVNYMVVGY